MSVSTRSRGFVLRAAKQFQSIQAVQRIPGGVLPLVAATLVLVIVPFARAAGDGSQPQAAATTGAASPQLSTSAVRPKVKAKLVRSHDVGRKGLKATGRISGVGRGKASVRLWVRTSGSKRWKIATSKKVASGKKFKLSWDGTKPGRYMTRVSVHKNGKKAVDNTGRAYVFTRGHASYYGPGLYGGGLACGGRLSPSTVGVAHKTLPCGTRVSFTLGNGRVVTAPVVDRGPFIAGRDWDLTAGLKRKLRFGDVGAVWAAH